MVMTMPSNNIDDQQNRLSFIQACPLLLDTNTTGSSSSSDIHKLKKYNVPTLYSLQYDSHNIIRQEFLKVLKIHQYDNGGCGLSVSEMAMWLGVENEEDVITIGDVLIQSQDDEQQLEDEDIICKVHNNRDKKCQYALVSSLRRHIDERIKWHCSGNETLQSAANNGSSSSSSLIDIVAQEVQLTSEDVAMLLQESERNETTTKTATANPHYTSRIETQVLATLSGITAPISLDKLFDNEKDQTIIVSLVKKLCQEGHLPGTVSSSSSSSLTNTVYTPNIFINIQRNLVNSFFQTNHYITEKKCVGVGIVGSSKMEEFVKESFPDVMLLSHSIIDPKFICQPLETAIQTALLNEGFADLKALIPLDVANSNDVEQLINECLVDVLKAQEDTTMYEAFSKGTVLINSDSVLFFSHEMCQKSVANTILDPLVESYSKQKAREIVESRSRGAAARGSKKGKSSSQTIESTSDEDLVPLRHVANCIGEHYPDLLQLQQTYEEEFGGADSSSSLSWSPEEASTDKCDGPLIEFCRVVIYSQIERKCTRAVKAEVAILDSARHGVSVSERSVGAAKQMDAQEAFEHEFKDLCYLLQLLAKTIESFSSKNVFSCTDICALKRELLIGIGSNFAKTVTEYCLYKHNIQEGSHVLAFDSAQGLGRPPVDMLDFPSVSLQYKQGEGGKGKDPLNYLRKLLPGSSGLSLVRIWQLIEVKDENKVNENLDELITHLTETCLTLVGIPFSILDKKTEKKVTTQRRQGLIEHIEKSQDPGEILNTCVVLIYQNTRNLVIAGETMISLVLDLFDEEKKIPKKVTEVLLKLKQEGSDVSPELLALAKHFGTAKNSKSLSAMCE